MLSTVSAALLVVLGLLLPAGMWASGVDLPIPEGVLPPEIPADNPLTAEKVALGRRLFFDKRLSRDDTVSCATCHDPRHAFVDPRGTPTSAGVGGARGVRNAPTVLDAAFLAAQFWDGRAETLEAQAAQPILNPVEMAMPDAASLAQKLRALPGYPDLFRRAFGDRGIRLQTVAQAIASFERTLISLDAPIDRFLKGDRDALSPAAQRVWKLFNGKARCNSCHGYVAALPVFTDDAYHNIGVAAKDVRFRELARQVEHSPESLARLSHEPGIHQLGRFLVSRKTRDLGAFKTPQLRNVARTAPYMHDGSEATLADVIEFYDRGGNPNPWLDGGIRPLGLLPREKADLVALLESFTSADLDRFEDLAPKHP